MAKRAAPTWEKSSLQLVAFFEKVAPNGTGIVHRKMFGYPACFLHGNLFVGLHKQSLLFRLSESGLADFLKLDGAAPFAPMPGRISKGFAVLLDPMSRDPHLISNWIANSLEFARSLPAKDKANAAVKKGAKAKK